MNGKNIIGTRNAGYEIIMAEYYNTTCGYCIGRNEHEYVTWFFSQWDRDRDKEPSFYHGHYLSIDHDAPFKSACRAKADYHHRMMQALKTLSEYGG